MLVKVKNDVMGGGWSGFRLRRSLSQISPRSPDLPAASASTEAGRLALQELRALPEDRAALETETRVNLLSDIG